MTRIFIAVFAALAAGCHPVPPSTSGDSKASEAADLEAARALFERNIQAIQDRDKDAYLACYRDDVRLVRTGPEGVKLGFEGLAESTPANASEEWPESLDASDMQVHWLAPGVVYGTYRYRVVIAGEASEGISERVFLDQDGRWRISVSTAFPTMTDPEPPDSTSEE